MSGSEACHFEPRSIGNFQKVLWMVVKSQNGSPLGGECIVNQNTSLGFYVKEKQTFIALLTLST
jgi:hypothetical protein